MEDPTEFGKHWVFYSGCCQPEDSDARCPQYGLHGPPRWAILNCAPKTDQQDAYVYLHGEKVPAKDLVGILGPHIPAPRNPDIEGLGWDNGHYAMRGMGKAD